MKTQRRDFLKLSGIAGLSIASGGNLKGYASESEKQNKSDIPQLIKDYKNTYKQRFNMSGYAAPKIDNVRVGIIGLGQRGPAHMWCMSRIEGVEIKALCDLIPQKAEACKKRLNNSRHNPDLYAGSKDEWKKLCERDDIDLVIVTTPWYMHTSMAVYAMNHGKHVASEVPAAGTLEECPLVGLSRRDRRSG